MISIREPAESIGFGFPGTRDDPAKSHPSRRSHVADDGAGFPVEPGEDHEPRTSGAWPRWRPTAFAAPVFPRHIEVCCLSPDARGEEVGLGVAHPARALLLRPLR